MQSISKPALNIRFQSWGVESSSSSFLLLALTWVLLSALIASCSPLAFSIATVFLFAAPHNWIELRYFLSRLPSRFGPLRGFFCSSFAGVAILACSYIALIVISRSGWLAYDQSVFAFQSWILLFYSWLAALLVLRRDFAKWNCDSSSQFALSIRADLKRRNLGLLLIAACALVSIMKPIEFGVCLTYMHPLVGICILDREIKRSRQQWSFAYRCVIVFACLLIGLMVMGLSQSPSISLQSNLDSQIVRHTGSFLMDGVSTHLLVSLHTFLENLHYGVWLIAIPIAARLFERKKLEPGNMPIARTSSIRQSGLKAVFAVSTLGVFAFWAAFLNDYAATRDFYFIVAVVHILAELPFLLWIL